MQTKKGYEPEVTVKGTSTFIQKLAEACATPQGNAQGNLPGKPGVLGSVAGQSKDQSPEVAGGLGSQGNGGGAAQPGGQYGQEQQGLSGLGDDQGSRVAASQSEPSKQNGQEKQGGQKGAQENEGDSSRDTPGSPKPASQNGNEGSTNTEQPHGSGAQQEPGQDYGNGNAVPGVVAISQTIPYPIYNTSLSSPVPTESASSGLSSSIISPSGSSPTNGTKSAATSSSVALPSVSARSFRLYVNDNDDLNARPVRESGDGFMLLGGTEEATLLTIDPATTLKDPQGNFVYFIPNDGGSKRVKRNQGDPQLSYSSNPPHGAIRYGFQLSNINLICSDAKSNYTFYTRDQASEKAQPIYVARVGQIPRDSFGFGLVTDPDFKYNISISSGPTAIAASPTISQALSTNIPNNSPPFEFSTPSPGVQPAGPTSIPILSSPESVGGPSSPSLQTTSSSMATAKPTFNPTQSEGNSQTSSSEIPSTFIPPSSSATSEEDQEPLTSFQSSSTLFETSQDLTSPTVTEQISTVASSSSVTSTYSASTATPTIVQYISGFDNQGLYDDPADGQLLDQQFILDDGNADLDYCATTCSSYTFMGIENGMNTLLASAGLTNEFH
ncbi:uncharacterized protein KY384_004633 [Bacidia gigantensis]|uniref:uncharacterized protein n=1 Tax=Bacidia gigantensis TaxID=2732470 RepID=UPI001D03CD9F|nr:uncharacterized protein KY384_004633 [Bacidia gigantensis]KAG8531275.1 hypothetical protein KY384_004633 [Bacidia gigantensis]